jgi:hypothetical protein
MLDDAINLRFIPSKFDAKTLLSPLRAHSNLFDRLRSIKREQSSLDLFGVSLDNLKGIIEIDTIDATRRDHEVLI